MGRSKAAKSHIDVVRAVILIQVQAGRVRGGGWACLDGRMEAGPKGCQPLPASSCSWCAVGLIHPCSGGLQSVIRGAAQFKGPREAWAIRRKAGHAGKQFSYLGRAPHGHSWPEKRSARARSFQRESRTFART
jgi:hypothetical protein